MLVSGQRQVGKSTLLRHIAGEDYSCLSFDDPILVDQLKRDPRLFLLDHPGKLILDEIQHVPELFPLLKMEVDRAGRNGMYLLSGSHAFHLMRDVSESMAGRIALLTLAGLSMREILGLPFNGPFIPSPEALANRQKANISHDDVWQLIFQGFYPRLHVENANRDAWYAAYAATCIERDVRQLINVTSAGDFVWFLSAVAARSGELLNYNAIAGDIGISVNTARSWLSILEAAGVVYLLQPWAASHLKRALKTPKVFVMDTGLLAWLTRWPAPETIRSGAKAGQFFESFVTAEIIKSFYNGGIARPDLYFYRDKEQNEIDLIIQDGRILYPIEIKMSASPDPRMARAFRFLPEIAAADELTVGQGTILCQYPEMTHLRDDLIALPVQYL